MGEETALRLCEQGYLVYGSVLNLEEQRSLAENARRRHLDMQVLQMDVTRPDSVAAAVTRIITDHGRIDILVHFAGMGLRGFFEDLSTEEIRNVFDINVFGTMAVTRAILPHMRAVGSGRILLTTSIAGRIGSMSISGYASSKFAIEGFAECLAQEVAPFGIHVSLLEPGLISTPHFTRHRNRAKRAMDPDGLYYPWFCQHEHIVDEILKRNTFTAQGVASEVYKILTAHRPRLRYIVGSKAKLVIFLRRYIPGELFERTYFKGVRRLVTSPSKPYNRLD